jgi:NADH-quinone oxidoreductase subunit E
MNNNIPVKQLDSAVQLSESEITAIEHECALYESRPAAAIDALQIVQRKRGWISDDSLNAIAELLTMSPTELEGVATFYNLIYRQKVGQHVLHLCDSISCWLHDAPQLAAHIKSSLKIDFGQTTNDGLITLLPNVCLGCCDKAPAMMLDGELIDSLDINKVDKILQDLQGKGDQHG